MLQNCVKGNMCIDRIDIYLYIHSYRDNSSSFGMAANSSHPYPTSNPSNEGGGGYAPHIPHVTPRDTSTQTY